MFGLYVDWCSYRFKTRKLFKTVNREYKDALFKRCFEDKHDLLELYNALNKRHMFYSIGFAVILVLYGIIIGSFLNVCIYRLPKKENIVTTRSHCMPPTAYSFQFDKSVSTRTSPNPAIKILNPTGISKVLKSITLSANNALAIKQYNSVFCLDGSAIYLHLLWDASSAPRFIYCGCV